MANDFLDKYKTKGSDDLETIAQQAPPAPKASVPQPAQGSTPAPQGAPTTFAETAEQTPAAAPSGGMRFEQDATNGFSAPPARTAAAYAAPARTGAASKTVLGVPVLYIGIAVAAIFAIVLAILLLGRGKALPAMDGWSTSEAEFWASENKVNVRVEKIYSDEISSGTVISQSPIAGERVGGGEFLTITISDGPDLSTMVFVPDIMSMTMAEVEAWADENFMTTVRITTQTSDTVASGKVISFTVNDNTVLADEIRRDTPFYVVFSKGKPVGEAVEVPNFLTMSVSEAEAFALEKELTLIKEEEFSETVSEGNIIRQDIKAAETVYAGDSITIVVSKGKEILVPNFYALSRELAAATASGLGIQTLVEEAYSAKEKDTLISQSIAAGTLYADEDIVVLKYSKGNTVFLDSYIGQDVSALKQWCEGYNEEGASLSVSTIYIENNAAAGTILKQEIAKQNIAIDAEIEVMVSKGKVVIMPSLAQASGSAYNSIITKEYVATVCEELGLIPFFIEEKNSSYKAGQVWQQGAVAGSEVAVGTVVTFKIVPVTAEGKVTVPDFTSLSIAAVKTEAEKFAVTYQDENGTYISESALDDTYKVIKQSITKDTKVVKGSAIIITVKALEPAVVTYAVPDFEGMTYQEAVEEAKANDGDFVLTFIDDKGNKLDQDGCTGKTVSEQSADAVAEDAKGLAAGSNITLTMSEATS